MGTGVDAESWVGQTLADGRYQIVKLLGKGGMGSVLQALDTRLETDVVVKFPHRAMLADPDFARRFARETRSLIKLEHPHIVRINDVGEEDGMPFLVMPFLGGGSLNDRRPRDNNGNYKRTKPSNLSGWVADVAKALDFIHSKGYVHRDIKPDNILFDAHKNVYVSDFGIAKAVGDEAEKQTNLTGTGVIGTPGYIAPEILLGHKYDGQSDQYSLASAVYELLAGRRPFEGTTPAVIIGKQTLEEAPDLREIRGGISDELAGVIMRGLNRDPAERFESCVAFAKALETALTAPVSKEPKRTVAAGGNKATKPPRPSKTGKTDSGSTIVDPPSSTGIQPPPLAGRTQPVPSGAVVPAGAAPQPERRRSGSSWLVWLGILLVIGGGSAVVFHLLNREKNDGTDNGQDVTNKDGSGGSKTEKSPDVNKSPIDQVTQKTKQTVPANPPNGKTNVAVNKKQTAAKPWKLLQKLDGHTDSVQSLAFLADSERILSGSYDRTMKLWNAKSAATLRTFRPKIKTRGQTDSFNSVAVSPDGRLIATAHSSRAFRLWNLESGEILDRIEDRELTSYAVAFSPDGSLLAIASYGKVLLWDVVERKLRTTLDVPSGSVYDVEFSPKGDRLATAGVGGAIKLWDVQTGECRRTIQVEGQPQLDCLAFSPDGTRLVAAGGRRGPATVWDLSNGKALLTLKDQLGKEVYANAVAYSPDGSLICSGSDDGTTWIWKAGSGSQVTVLSSSGVGPGRSVKCVAFSPDGQLLAVGRGSGRIEIRATGLAPTPRKPFVKIAGRKPEYGSNGKTQNNTPAKKLPKVDPANRVKGIAAGMQWAGTEQAKGKASQYVTFTIVEVRDGGKYVRAVIQSGKEGESLNEHMLAVYEGAFEASSSGGGKLILEKPGKPQGGTYKRDSALLNYYTTKATLTLDSDGKLTGVVGRYDIELKPAKAIKPFPDAKQIIKDVATPGLQWEGTLQHGTNEAQRVRLLFTEVRDEGRYVRAVAFPEVNPFNVVVLEGTLRLTDAYRNTYGIRLQKKTLGRSRENNLFNHYSGYDLELRPSFDGRTLFGVVNASGGNQDRLKLKRSEKQQKVLPLDRNSFAQAIRKACVPGTRWVGTLQNKAVKEEWTIEVLFGSQNAEGTSVQVAFRIPRVKGQIIGVGTFHLDDKSVNAYCIELTKKTEGSKKFKCALFNQYKDYKVRIGLSPDGKNLFGYVNYDSSRTERFILARPGGTDGKTKTKSK